MYKNCFDRVLSGAQLSNNMIEAWHKPFHNDCKNHPTFSKCCHNFQLEQKLTEFRKLKSDSGHVHDGQKKKQKLKEKTILDLVSKFDSEHRDIPATNLQILKYLISFNLILC